MAPSWTEAEVMLSGSVFHYTRTGGGNKPALVLLHGFSDSGPCWLRTARALEAEFDVIMPDLRGHGLSSRLGPGVVPDHPADMAAFIRALGLQHPVLGGHSLGAGSAAALEARFPGMVRALILEDPPWRAQPKAPSAAAPARWQWLVDAREKGSSLEDMIAIGRQTRPSFQKEELEPWARAKLQFDLRSINNMGAAMDWLAVVSAIRVPVLLLTADVEQGAIVTPEVAQKAAALSPLLRLAAVPGAGHNIRRDNFPAFIAAVCGFLSGLV